MCSREAAVYVFGDDGLFILVLCLCWHETHAIRNSKRARYERLVNDTTKVLLTVRVPSPPFPVLTAHSGPRASGRAPVMHRNVRRDMHRDGCRANPACRHEWGRPGSGETRRARRSTEPAVAIRRPTGRHDGGGCRGVPRQPFMLAIYR